jgi:tRNA1Val (adenine37-N6)-methyltransferase
MAMADDDITSDTLLRGRVRIFQPARGSRMTLDPVLLAGFVAPPYGRFLDIGCGVGPLSFSLLATDPEARGVGVEIQPRLAALAARGRDANGWGERLEIVGGDVRELGERLGAGSFDLVITNPPYRTVESSPPSPNLERAIAFNEIALRLADWVEVAARAVRRGGRVAAILPFERAPELRLALRKGLLRPVRLRPVHPRAGQSASRILIEARSADRDLPVVEAAVEEPPLVVHAPDGGFTPEVRRMLGETA